MSIATATGPIIAASWVNPPLFAVELSLALVYFRRFPRDFLPYKLAVMTTLVIECGTIMSVMAAAWMYSIKHFGDAAYAASQPWPISFYVSSTALTAIICQTFLSYRVYKFTSNWLYMPFLALPSVASLIGAIMSSYIVVGAGLADRPLVTKWVTLWLSGKLAADVLIAICQVWTLRKVQAEFEESRSIIRRLSLQAIETGSVTAVYASIALIVYSLESETNLSPMLGMVMGRVYGITLLVNLNRRAHAQSTNGLSNPSGGRVHMQSGSDQFGGKSHAGGSRGGVNVQTLTNVHFDEATVYEPAQPAAIIYRSKRLSADKSERNESDTVWAGRTPGQSEIELGRPPLSHN